MRTVKGLSDSVRLSIINEHLCGASKSSLARKYNLGNYRIISVWMRKFGISYSTKVMCKEKLSSEEQLFLENEEIQRLRQELKELQSSLAYERMRGDAYNTLIDLAEDELKIDIRKKCGTKPSRR